MGTVHHVSRVSFVILSPFITRFWYVCHFWKLRRRIEDPRVWGVRSLIVLLVGGGIYGVLGRILLNGYALFLLSWPGGQERRSTEWRPWEGRDVLWAELVLLLQAHGIPQSHVIRHKRPSLTTAQRVAQHQWVTVRLGKARLQRDTQGIWHHPTRRFWSKPKWIWHTKGWTHWPLGGRDWVRC